MLSHHLLLWPVCAFVTASPCVAHAIATISSLTAFPDMGEFSDGFSWIPTGESGGASMIPIVAASGTWSALEKIPLAGAGTLLLPAVEGDGLVAYANTKTAASAIHEMIAR